MVSEIDDVLNSAEVPKPNPQLRFRSSDIVVVPIYRDDCEGKMVHNY